jgi:membrane protein implicated in regulation of membrane protease activity
MTNLKKFLRTIFISPDEPRLRAGWRLLIHLILFFIVFFLMGILAKVYTVFVGNLPLPIDFIIALIAVTLSIFLARRWLDHRSFRSLGLQWDAFSARDILVGVFIPAILFALIFAVECMRNY